MRQRPQTTLSLLEEAETDLLLLWLSCFPQVDKHVYDLANLISQSNYLSNRRVAANQLPQPESADHSRNYIHVHYVDSLPLEEPNSL